MNDTTNTTPKRGDTYIRNGDVSIVLELVTKPTHVKWLSCVKGRITEHETPIEDFVRVASGTINGGAVFTPGA
jgi:hypothetical protein